MSVIILATMLCSLSNTDYNEAKSEERGVAICNRHVTASMKNRIYDRDGISDRQGYCINHIVPLAIGGSNSMDNLEAMAVDEDGACHVPGEVDAINCFLRKECTQQEAFSIMGLEY